MQPEMMQSYTIRFWHEGYQYWGITYDDPIPDDTVFVPYAQRIDTDYIETDCSVPCNVILECHTVYVKNPIPLPIDTRPLTLIGDGSYLRTR